jgi:hypothetical protein
VQPATRTVRADPLDEEEPVDVRIGVIYTAKEIDVELAEDVDRAALKSSIEESLAADERVLWLTDRHGRDIAVPTAKIAYVEIGSPDSERRIGFSG